MNKLKDIINKAKTETLLNKETTNKKFNISVPLTGTLYHSKNTYDKGMQNYIRLDIDKNALSKFCMKELAGIVGKQVNVKNLKDILSTSISLPVEFVDVYNTEMV